MVITLPSRKPSIWPKFSDNIKNFGDVNHDECEARKKVFLPDKTLNSDKSLVSEVEARKKIDSVKKRATLMDLYDKYKDKKLSKVNEGSQNGRFDIGNGNGFESTGVRNGVCGRSKTPVHFEGIGESMPLKSEGSENKINSFLRKTSKVNTTSPKIYRSNSKTNGLSVKLTRTSSKLGLSSKINRNPSKVIGMSPKIDRSLSKLNSSSTKLNYKSPRTVSRTLSSRSSFKKSPGMSSQRYNQLRVTQLGRRLPKRVSLHFVRTFLERRERFLSWECFEERCNFIGNEVEVLMGLKVC
ncbi:unnamed protein product [Bursaphelenchus okinawaensis]|uniref:Uncharacterized protein n=1 Tax=Bursaphelenchus okinawaensis TaxID=465554 RepID=A0A811L8R3_9BILA|nr:unnamed protein product [Bursaphelenchus okinawaensis]CAG9118173.1 unnamed protein product [Bursaphelenchus okinawaensis]